MIFGVSTGLMVRLVTAAPSVQSGPPVNPSPDTGGVAAPEPMPADGYPHGSSPPITINSYYVVGDEAGLLAERRAFLARQRAQRQVAGPQGVSQSSVGVPRNSEIHERPTRGRSKQQRALDSWAALAQVGFFRLVQRWRCRELQKLWGSCTKVKRRLETNPWEVARNSDWAKQ